MLLYYNKYGQLLENLEYGPTAKVGSTTFKIIAYFDLGAELDFSNLFSNATIDFLKPDLNDNGYPPMLMKLNDNFVFDSSIENSNYFHNGQKYSVYEFDFGSFTDGQDIVRLLDTPGMWFFTITLIGASGNFNVQGRGSFNVGHSASESDDLTELSIYTILESVYSALGTKLNIANGIVVLNDETHPSGFFDGFTVGQVFYQKNEEGGYLLEKTANGIEKLVDFSLGFIDLADTGDIINLSLCERKLCIINYNNELYVKGKESEISYEFFRVNNLDITRGNYVSIFKNYIEVDKQNGEANFIQETLAEFGDIGTIELDNITDPLSVFDLEQAQKNVCFIIYDNNVYVKISDYYNYDGNDYIAFTKESDLQVLIVGNEATIHSNILLIDRTTGAITNYYKDLGSYYTKSGSDIIFAKLNGNNTFSGTNVFDKSPQTNEPLGNESPDTKLVTKDYVKRLTGDIPLDTTLQDEIDDIKDVIPSDASINNKLIANSQKGAANGVATLDNNAKIPLNQLPDAILGQVKWVGNIYIVSSTDADNYNMRECGVVQLTDYALATLGLTGQTEITINGLTVTGTNLVTYLDLFNAIIEKYDDARLVSMFFIVSSRINHNGPVWTGYNILTDVAFNGFMSPSEQEYFTHVSTGDWIMILSISNLGSISYARVDNSDAVVSVNHKTGAVTLYGTDIKLSSVDNTTVNEKFGSIETDIATINNKLPRIKDYVVAPTDWQLIDNKYVAQLDAGSNFVIDDNACKIYTPTGINDLIIKDTYGINVSSDATTQKFTFICTRGDSAPTENVNFTITMIGGGITING